MKKKKPIYMNTYLWAVALFAVAFFINESNDDLSTALALCSVLLFFISICRSVVKFFKWVFRVQEPDPPVVIPEPVQEPNPIPVEVEPVVTVDEEESLPEDRSEPRRRATRSTTSGIHNIERFHRLENNVFSRKARKGGFVVFDLETTGLRQYDRIIEIAAIKYGKDFREIDTFETLVNPEKKIPEASIAIHGINDDMVADSPTISEVLPEFFAFIDGYPIIGYNAASFDIRYLNSAVNRCGMNCAVEYADALPWARNHYQLDSYKLGNVAESIGLDPVGAHRAMGDCRMLGAIVEDMMEY